MKKYVFLPDIAIADIAFEAYGKDEEELFQHAAEALLETMVNVGTVNAKEKRVIQLSNAKLDALLFDFLNEIVFLKDRDYLVFKTVKIKLKKNKNYQLAAELKGEKINPERHDLGNDIKAITMHLFEVKKEKDYWKARIVVDI
ncbi:MAG TPA: archease [Candidatus Nanoarchaeia archaeon]|nr:archease [Candidatus Nanoarchaeia archaeon]